MNFIDEIKAFHDLTVIKSLSTGQIALWYALFNINNKCAWIEWFTVANQTLELTSGLSKSGVAKCRNVLKQYNLIDFKPNGTKSTSYKMYSITNSNRVSNQDSERVSERVSNQDSNRISERNGNTINRLDETKLNETNIESNARASDAPTRQRHRDSDKYGSYKNVLFTDEEFEKLKTEFPNDWSDRIERLSEYIASTGKKYTNFLATIRSWAKKDKSVVNGVSKNQQPDFSDLSRYENLDMDFKKE